MALDKFLMLGLGLEFLAPHPTIISLRRGVRKEASVFFAGGGKKMVNELLSRISFKVVFVFVFSGTLNYGWIG